VVSSLHSLDGLGAGAMVGGTVCEKCSDVVARDNGTEGAIIAQLDPVRTVVSSV